MTPSEKSPSSPVAELELLVEQAALVDDLRLRVGKLDRRRKAQLGTRLEQLSGSLNATKSRKAQPLSATQRATKLSQLAEKIQRAEDYLAARQSAAFKIEYPQELPVSSIRDDFLSLLDNRQVIIVAGETGSGKTTQIPKMLMEYGCGEQGLIAHTQPRRVAARSVASRLAEELTKNIGGDDSGDNDGDSGGEKSIDNAGQVGGVVGYQYRFDQQVSAQTRLKVMTDGILLAEISHDKLLLEYDAIVIDEAHERSLNIDFLLGYLKLILPRRPDLKVIITSATIDVERFSTFFDDAPILSVDGRSYPVEEVFLDDLFDNAVDKGLDGDGEGLEQGDGPSVQQDLNSYVLRALDMIEADTKDAIASGRPRDVLVFLAGEREIRDLSKILRHRSHDLDVLPMYSRLSRAEQNRIFETGGGKRRLVLSTNVAETSITVPGIGYVIDSGLARVSRYSSRSKLQRLPVENISKASARQRAGRCGRVAPGVCIRLYSRDEFEAFAAFTEPEVLRTNLASVILTMKRIGLGGIEGFPFVQQPDARLIRAGLKTLEELSALDKHGRISSIGRQMSAMPIDPKLSRMVIAAKQLQVEQDVLVIVAALSVQDPREFPVDSREQAQQKHRRFAFQRSDFISWLALWEYFNTLRQELSQSQLRKRCKREYLSYNRLMEWRDVHRQLLISVNAKLSKAEPTQSSLVLKSKTDPDNLPSDQDFSNNTVVVSISESRYEKIHRCIVAGIPTQLGKLSEKGIYRGPRSLSFQLFPGSAIFKKSPGWVVSAEIVETSKVYARQAAAIDTAWVIDQARHLIKYQYAEPYWDAKRGQVLVHRSTQLFGIQLKEKEQVAYAKIDRQRSRQVFIQQGLVGREINLDKRQSGLLDFWSKNTKLIEKIGRAEDKLRRRDVLVEDRVIEAHYDQHLPQDVCGVNDLCAWYKRATAEEKTALLLSKKQLMENELPAQFEQDFPDVAPIGAMEFAMRYTFAPGELQDGVKVIIPLSQIHSLPLNSFDWAVPGLLRERCMEMLKLLPKAQRKLLVPIPRVTDELIHQMDADKLKEDNVSLLDALSSLLKRYYNMSVDREQWRQTIKQQLSTHLRPTFAVQDNRRKTLSSGKDLAALQRDSMQFVEEQIEPVIKGEFSAKLVSHWQADVLEKIGHRIPVAKGVQAFAGFNLSDEGQVFLHQYATEQMAIAESTAAIVQLLASSLSKEIKFIKKGVFKDANKILAFVKLGNRATLSDDLVAAAVAAAAWQADDKMPPRTASEFEQVKALCRSRLTQQANQLEAWANEHLAAYKDYCEQLAGRKHNYPTQCEAIDKHLRTLFFSGYMTEHGIVAMANIGRYIQASSIRLQRFPRDEKKDSLNGEKLASLQQPLDNLLYKYPLAAKFDKNVARYRWLLEELRVSLFAQQLKTTEPVSVKRVEKALSAINFADYPLV